jgi:hypothetical protein
MSHNALSIDQISFRRLYDSSLLPEPHTDEISLLNSSEKTHEAASPFFSSQSISSLKRLTSAEESQAHKKQKSDPSNQFWDDIDISVLNQINLETTDSLFFDSLPNLPFRLSSEDASWTGIVPSEEPKGILHKSNSVKTSSSPASAPEKAAAQTDSSVSIHTGQAALKKATREQLKEATKRAIEIDKQSTVIQEYKNKGIRISRSSLSAAVRNFAHPDLKRATPKQLKEAAKKAREIHKQSTVIQEYKSKGIRIPRSSLSHAVKKYANPDLDRATPEEMQEAAKRAIEIGKQSTVIEEYQKKGIHIPQSSLSYAVKLFKSRIEVFAAGGSYQHGVFVADAAKPRLIEAGLDRENHARFEL